MDVDEGDDYSDDDLDALPVDAFHTLEEHAITSTQQAATRNHVSYLPAGNAQNKGPGPLANRLERLSVVSGLGPKEDSGYPQQPSSDYGDLDDEMLDGEIYDAAGEPGVNAIQASRAASIPYSDNTQREHRRQQRYGMPSKHPDPGPPQVDAEASGGKGVNGVHLKPIEAVQTLYDGGNTRSGQQSDVVALQAQIEEVSFVPSNPALGSCPDTCEVTA